MIRGIQAYDFWADEPTPEAERSWRTCLFQTAENCTGKVLGFTGDRECQKCRAHRIGVEKYRQMIRTPKGEPNENEGLPS